MKILKQLTSLFLLLTILVFTSCHKDETQSPTVSNSVALATTGDNVSLHKISGATQLATTQVPIMTLQSQGGNTYLLTATIYVQNQYALWDFVLYKNGAHYDGPGYKDSNYIQNTTYSIIVNLDPGTYYFNVYNAENSFNTPSITIPQPPVTNFDQFPAKYNGTAFNYNTGVNPNINGTIINVSDTQPVLVVGQKIYSPNQNYYLTLQTDGNLVLYQTNTSSGTDLAIWSSETQGKPSASLYFQTDGNLVIYPGTNTPANHTPNSGLWGSNIDGTALGTIKYAFYRLQDDGNLVFYWPNYYGHTGFVNIIAGSSDSESGRSTHIGNLNHPLWSPAMQQANGSDYTPSPIN